MSRESIPTLTHLRDSDEKQLFELERERAGEHHCPIVFDQRGQVCRHLSPGSEAVRDVAALPEVMVEDLLNLRPDFVPVQFADSSHADDVKSVLIVVQRGCRAVGRRNVM